MKENLEDKIKLIISYLGGKDNILSHTHCVTRIRLIIKNKKLVEIEKLKTIEGIINIVQPSGQLHIIIGPQVENYYQIFNKLVTNNVKLKKDNLIWYQKLLKHFSDIFIPIVPALVAGGLILGIRNILENKWNDDQNSALVNYSFAKGLNEFLWIPAQAIFWYIPVTICYSIFKNKNSPPVLGIIIGLSLLLPPLVDVYQVAKDSKNSLWIFDIAPAFDFGIFKFPYKIQYTGQVIPAIIIGFFGVWLQKKLDNITHSSIKQIVVPLFTILISYTLALTIIGPLGYLIGSIISMGVSWTLTNQYAKYIFSPFLGLFYAPIVITGIHTMFNALMIQNTATLGGSFIFPILCISNIAQGSACLMFSIKNWHIKKIKDTGISSTISAYLGITEPAMYGINLRFLFPFLAAIIASGIGCLLLTIFGITSNGIGNGGLLGILSIQIESKVENVNTLPGTGYLWFSITCIVVILTSLILTHFFTKIPKFKKIYLENLKHI